MQSNSSKQSYIQSEKLEHLFQETSDKSLILFLFEIK